MKIYILSLLLAVTLATPHHLSHPRVSIKSRSEIVGGTDAKPGEFPYQVSIQRDYYGFFQFPFCGGSIYTSKFIITAAHCTMSVKANQILVVAGEHNLSLNEGFEQTLRGKRIIQHEKFNINTFENDIAIIELENEFKLNDRVQPIDLPSQGETVTGNCVVTGWGTLQSGGETPDILQKVTVPILSDEDCISKTFYSQKLIFDSMICAGYLEGGKDACQGDSGGPMACKDKLVGIVSWGFGCAARRVPGVYTEVSYFVDWIEKNTA